jgi:hypothetical protein
MRDCERAHAHRRCGQARLSVQLIPARSPFSEPADELIEATRIIRMANPAVPKRIRVGLIVAEGAGEGGEFVEKRRERPDIWPTASSRDSAGGSRGLIRWLPRLRAIEAIRDNAVPTVRVSHRNRESQIPTGKANGHSGVQPKVES